jgi:PIN domain nuclease of toxin-antitoxin system
MILLDTCTLLWLVHAPVRLSAAAREVLLRADEVRAVSAVSAWEIAIKAASGKLTLPRGMTALAWFTDACTDYGLAELPVGARQFCQAMDLPPIHRDPCDRVIVATALDQRARIVTADTVIRSYPGVEVVW